MMRLLSFHAGVETAVKMHSMAITNTSDESTYRRNTDIVEANMAMAKRKKSFNC